MCGKLRLKDGQSLYHGSYIAVPKVELSRCNKGLDFGRGFYVTTSKQQAVSFVSSSVKRNIREKKIPGDFDVNEGQVSIYAFHTCPELKIKLFFNADVEWLHFVASNRNHRLFPEIQAEFQEYDIIGGKIADDDTAVTLNSYVTGLYGTPGDKEVDRFVINKLLPNRLEDQLCFRTDFSLDFLEFVRSEQYGCIRSKYGK